MRWIIVLMLVVGVAHADNFEVEVGLLTHHWMTEGLNEDNRLIGVGYDGWEGSTFVNSYGDRSYSLGHRWELDYGFSVSAGLIEGYGENAKWFPVRFGNTVAYGSLNYTTPGPVAFRARQMGEVTITSFIVRQNP